MVKQIEAEITALQAGLGPRSWFKVEGRGWSVLCPRPTPRPNPLKGRGSLILASEAKQPPACFWYGITGDHFAPLAPADLPHRMIM
jgi:hypothetical protein